jgi:hypothetical protein
MSKPTREDAKKCLVMLDKIEDWINDNLDEVINMDSLSIEDDEDDLTQQLPINFDSSTFEENFENIRSALRYCL